MSTLTSTTVATSVQDQSQLSSGEIRHALFDVIKTKDRSGFKFTSIRESTVSRAKTSCYFKDLDKHTVSYVIVAGCGSAGMPAAYVIAKNRPDLRVNITESSIAPGGSSWLGGQLFNAMVIRKLSHLFLKEFGVPYEDEGVYVVLKHAALFNSSVLSKVLQFSIVKSFDAAAVEDLVSRPAAGGRDSLTVASVVTNWTLVTMAHSTPCYMDPDVVELEGYQNDGTRYMGKNHVVILSTTGHDSPFDAFSNKIMVSIDKNQELGDVKG